MLIIVRLVGEHLYGKLLFTWLSQVLSLMASFVLSFFPRDVLDEIWVLIESVSEGFLIYRYATLRKNDECYCKLPSLPLCMPDQYVTTAHSLYAKRSTCSKSTLSFRW